MHKHKHKRTSTTTPMTSDDVEREVRPPGDVVPETARHARDRAQGEISKERLAARVTDNPH